MVELGWFPPHAWRNRDTKRMLSVAVNASSKIEMKPFLTRRNHTQDLGVTTLARDSNRSGEGEIRCISCHNGPIKPVESLALGTTLVVELR